VPASECRTDGRQQKIERRGQQHMQRHVGKNFARKNTGCFSSRCFNGTVILFQKRRIYRKHFPDIIYQIVTADPLLTELYQNSSGTLTDRRQDDTIHHAQLFLNMVG
jgi:hypothetical protein